MLSVDELIEKWQDVITTSDDWYEQNLAGEFLDDLKSIQTHSKG